jgi:hypothetical protein
MNRRIQQDFMIIAGIVLFMGCCGSKKAVSTELMTMESPSLSVGIKAPRTLVYKTRGDYFQRVPVLMNSTKDSILAYPDPVDVRLGDRLAVPTILKKGYLLDNRGIGLNTAFLTYTYQNYAALSKVPSMNQLMDSLLDRNPLTELWDCGPRTLYKKEVDELNALMEKGFPNCKSLHEVLNVTR